MSARLSLTAILIWTTSLSNCYAQLKFEHSYDKKTKTLECTITNESNNQVIFSQERNMYDGKSYITITFRENVADTICRIATARRQYDEKFAVIMEPGDIKKYDYNLKNLAEFYSATHAKSIRIEGTIRSMSLPSEETKVVDFDYTFDY